MNTQPPTARSPRYTLSIRGPRPDAAATTLARDVPALELTAAMRAARDAYRREGARLTLALGRMDVAELVCVNGAWRWQTWAVWP